MYGGDQKGVRRKMKQTIRVFTVESEGLEYIVDDCGIMCKLNGIPITSIDIPLLKIGEKKIEVECVE